MKRSLLSPLRGLLLSVATTCLLSVVAFGAEPAKPKVALSNSDCVKCHTAPSADIEAKGGAHKTNVTCQDCHVGHPPAVKKNVIPQCSMCHSDKPHYKLTNCQRCHNNPHTPKDIKLANNITDECLSCHSQQIVKLKQVPSKHTKLACSFCHNVHGKIPACTQCHKPHSADMGAADCKRCHQAHMPTAVTYASDTTNKMCASCHKQAFDHLASSDAKHKTVTCVTCHKEKHKMVPTCQSCHGAPHPAGMLAKFTKCGDCHSTAHKLNHWDSAKKAPAPAAPAAKSAPKKK